MATSDESEEVCFSKWFSVLTVRAADRDSLPPKFAHYWQNDVMSDVTISCQGRHFKAHRVILSGLSEYFEKAIQEKEAEDRGMTTLMLDCDPIYLDLCLSYLYMGHIDVNTKLVEGVANLAKQLSINHLYNECIASQWKDTVADVANCLDMWSVGDSVGDAEMLSKGRTVALQNFDEVIETEHFMNLDSSRVVELLSHDKLSVASQGDRLTAALMWVDHSRRERSHHLTTFLKTLPLRDMTRVMLRQTLRSPLLLSNTEACQVIQCVLDQMKTGSGPNDQGACETQPEPCTRLVSPIGNKQEPPGRRTVLSAPKVSPPVAPRKVSCLLSVGSHYEKTDDLSVTPFTLSREWLRLAKWPSSFPVKHYGDVACCVQRSLLHVTGLGLTKKEAWCYSMDSSQWSRYGDLQHARRFHCMVECKDELYVLGGRSESGDECVKYVEVLNGRTKTWKVAGQLTGTRCFNTSCCVVGGNILVHGVLHDNTALLLEYEPRTQLCQRIASYERSRYLSSHGVISAYAHIIMFALDATYVCALSHHQPECAVRKSSKYMTPMGYSILFLSKDGEFLMAVGGQSRKSNQAAHHFVYKARVLDVIHDTGSGWLPVDMPWNKGELVLFPGAHCEILLHLNDLESL